MPHAKAAALIAGLCLLCALAAPALARSSSVFAKVELGKLRAETRELIAAGDYPAAEKLARRQLDRAGQAFGERHPAYGSALLMLGRVLFQQGRYEEADALLRRGLHLREGYGRQLHENALVRGMTALGEVLAAQNNYAEAETLLRSALALTDPVLDPQRRFTVLLALGQLMKDLGRYPEAEALANQALDGIKESRGRDDPGAAARPGGPGRKGAALTLILLAQSHEDQGRPADAYPVALRALGMHERSRGAEHPDTARMLLFLGRVLSQMQRDAEALPRLESARAVAQKTLGNRHPLAGAIHLQLALAQEALGQLVPAEENYRAAVKVARGAGIPLALAQADRAYGRHLVQRERLREALPYYREAIGMLERVFAETRGQSEEIRNQFAGRVNAYHHELIELLVRLHDEDAGAGHDREALAVASLTQSRIFSELLRQADVSQFVREDAFKRLDKQRLAAVDRLRALRRELAASGVSEHDEPADYNEDEDHKKPASATAPQQQDARAENLRRQIADAKRRLAEVEEALRRSYPRYAELAQPQPVTVAELQQRLLQPGEVILTYSVLPSRLLVFAVARERFAMAAVPVGGAALMSKIRAVRASGEKFAAIGSLAALAALDPEKLHELYRLLAAPVEPLLAQAKHVLVAGDGPVHTLPLEMLVTRWGEAERSAFAAARADGPALAEYATPPYLGSRMQFRYLPSLSALPSQRLYAKPAVAYRRELVSFADPVFSDARSGARKSVPRLPETADEARQIAKLLGERTQIYLGEEAQETTVKSIDLRTTRYLHFATHGLLGGEFLQLKQSGSGTASQSGSQKPARGGQPALALTLVGSNLGAEDGLLTMGEVIQSLDINAELVVLSACNTAGENDINNGEGFAGLTRSFMYAGARALLVSHWSVESQSTQEFITDVFRNIKQGRALGDALFQARQAMLVGKAGSDRSRSHPYFWAPFVHVGD